MGTQDAVLWDGLHSRHAHPTDTSEKKDAAVVKIHPSKTPQNLHTSPSTLHLGMANFPRLPDNTPTPHQATAHRVFGWDLDSWKGFTQRSFFFRPGFSSLLIGKKKKVRALYVF